MIVVLIGSSGLAMATLLEHFRSPYLIYVSSATLLLGVVGLFDRRFKLTMLDHGIRYARWGRLAIPWEEFSAYRWVTWRNSRYLQLMPMRPSHVIGHFSLLGRLNHRLVHVIGAPEFSVAVSPLDVSDAELAAGISQYLPESTWNEPDSLLPA